MQACVQLPLSSGQADSSETADLRDCFAPAVAHSDTFWHGCFDRYIACSLHVFDSCCSCTTDPLRIACPMFLAQPLCHDIRQVQLLYRTNLPTLYCPDTLCSLFALRHACVYRSCMADLHSMGHRVALA